ncbi:MAG TPA: FecR domain-containing protein [Candidatus Rifleibacterium sp.]|nr:FecR domain-containing protein [Candidatus Rifleibacterium sp.]
MKRTILLLVAFLLLFSPCFAAEDSGIKFSDLHGEVTVRPDDNEEGWELAELSSKLNVLDHVKTEQDSGAILSMQDMTTFVVKPESEIILTVPSGQDSKVTLVAGNIWVNVKKMVTNGTMEVEMSQAVAGIKGTNITCSTSRDEDRIQVLRGIAEVLIRETQERMTVAEGEELVIKAGGKAEKVEIDVSAEQKKWDEQTSRMGESIQMNEVPDVLKGIMDAESAEFTRINEIFTKLVAMTSIEESEAMTVKKDAERFVGVLLEDNLILNSIRKRIDTAMQAPDLPAADRVRLVSLMKEVAAVLAKQQSYQSQITRIMRYEFKLSAVTEELGAELETLRTEMAQATSDVDAIKAVLAANPNGQGQDWFMEATQVCANAIRSLDEVLQKTSELLAQNPTSTELQAMIKNINSQRTAISTMMRSLVVVEVPAATIIEMSQIDDVLSDNMVILQREIDAYNMITDAASIRASQTAMERRLKASARILDSFARVKRSYTKAQRLYDSTVRASAGAKYKTSEQEELDSTWRNISDRFQQLGIVAQQLETNMADLERQLAEFLK